MIVFILKEMYCSKHNAQNGLEIRFLNVKPNDTFSYSIALIKGEIFNYNHRNGVTILQIVNENKPKFIENVEITIDGKFKVAVELTPGANLLKLQFCCIANEISIFFNKKNSPRYLLRIFYIICNNHDGSFQAPEDIDNCIERACEKIDLAIQMVQCLFAEMLTKHEFIRKSFEFIKCKPFQSSLSVEEARKMNQNDLWMYHAKEILAQETDSHHKYKYFGILACTRCENGVIKGNAALGIGDVALIGSGTLYAWPSTFDSIQRCFQNLTTIDKIKLMDDSNGRNTFGGCYATALGSICHEIGHIFDLGHSRDGIMGNDIDYVNRMFVIEKCPRDLPRRMVSKCTNDQNINETTTNSRLTIVKKTNSILTNYHNRRNDELTFITENCAIMLNFHKWFNQCENIRSCIRFNFKQKLIESTSPLALIEFRENGLCMKYYRFDVSNDIFNFTVETDVIKQNYELIALDKNGHIMKWTYSD